MITRFAPSPTGLLHLGHARAAYIAFQAGYTCLLRIEDIDHTRCRTDYSRAIYEDLAWLGFSWPSPVRIQSEHISAYQSALESLQDKSILYPCFKSRKALETSHGPAPISQSEYQTHIDSGRKPAFRLNIKKCHEIIGDLSFEETGPVFKGRHKIAWNKLKDEIIIRRDIGLSYHLCVTHDDAWQKVSHVIRGVDLFETTPYHRILQTLMGWPEPVYFHHDVLRNKTGRKLSKRNQDTTIRSLRDKGLSPDEVLALALK